MTFGITRLLSVFLLAALVMSCSLRQNKELQTSYQDITHSSQVFGKDKYYRLYLPDGYEQSNERYSVIYFFHGWGGRHFKDDNARLEYEMIKELVDKYKIILVMWDGNIDEEEPRPYNMGDHVNVTSEIQMKDYFPELVSHIDSTYRTKTDRSNRGIIGFSMGGLMSWFLAGKYPHMVCAAVSLTGSPEFFIGTPDNHTLFPLRYAFKNLEQVAIRMHNSTHDELVYLNEEVHRGALWHGGLSYEYWQFYGGHVVDDPGKTEVFERAIKFVTDAFHKPLPVQERWGHYDLYPDFEVWDYSVSSNKVEPGFLYLKNVSKNGFGIRSVKWLPDGPRIPGLSGEIKTAPVYVPNTMYHVVQYSPETNQVDKSTVMSDENGRLNFNFQGEREAGFFLDNDKPDLVVLDYSLNKNQRMIRPGKKNNLTLKVFNRGGDINKERNIQITLEALDSTTAIEQLTVVNVHDQQRVFSVDAGSLLTTKQPPGHGEPAWIKFQVNLQIGQVSCRDELMIPVFFDVPAFDSLKIDDGTLVKDRVFGTGDGNGVVAPGESIMIYQTDHRLKLYTDDPFVEKDREQVADEVLPAKWPDGFTLSSIVKISDRCPDGHIIEFLASYDTKTHMPIERKVTWGKVSVQVKKKH